MRVIHRSKGDTHTHTGEKRKKNKRKGERERENSDFEKKASFSVRNASLITLVLWRQKKYVREVTLSVK